MRISIDGQPAVPYGPQLHTVDLAPGSTHTFAVEPTTGTYRSHTFRVRIPSGQGRWELALPLELADAALFVNANVPGQVRVDEQSGSTGELLSITMREPSAYLRVKVTAPGHAEYNELVMLRAGQSQTLRVHLEPERSPTARTP